MVLARKEFDATNEAGDLLSNVQVRVELEGGGLVSVYSDRDGLSTLPNPFTVADGKVAFHAAGGAHKITLTSGAYTRALRYVPIGLGAESDLVVASNRGEWSAATTYAAGDYVVHGGVGIFISTGDDNLNNEPDDATPGSTTSWTYYSGVVGPSGFIGLWRGAWVTATDYALHDVVQESGSSYICVEAHTSGTFATDFAAGKWELVAAKGDPGGRLVLETETADAYTPVLADAQAKLKRLSDATGVTLTIPPNSSAAFSVGDTLSFEQADGGPVTIAGDTGVTVNVPAGFSALSAGEGSVFQALKVDTDEWLLFGGLEPTRTGYLLGSRQIFSVAGSYTWTRPAGCVAVLAEVVGSGGGGRGPAAGQGAGGGGAGGYSRKWITSGLGATEAVTVGVAGPGGAAGGTNGGNGFSSSFGTHCQATGGARGSNSGGVGGTGSGGDINAKGGSGNARIQTTDIYSGNGGSSHLSGGGYAGSAGSEAGTDGVYGSGGGGGRDGAAGGNGGAGVVIVWEYY